MSGPTGSPTEEAFAPPPPPPGATPPEDADALRGHHFKHLLGETSNRAVIGALMVLAGVAAGIYLKSAPLGGGAAAATLVLSILAYFFIADRRSADSFFATYAEARGMTLISSDRARFPETTPLLQKGDDRYAERLLEGPLAEGVEGLLANYTYEEVTYTKNGKQTDYHRYTLGYQEVPESVPLVPELFVQRRSGIRSLEKLEDAFRGPNKRVEFESDAFDRKYEIFVSEMQDLRKVHQLFSPTFIVWLVDNAPEEFAFELVGGKLCCYVSGHVEDAKALDGIASATAAVAKRLHDEALENMGA